MNISNSNVSIVINAIRFDEKYSEWIDSESIEENIGMLEEGVPKEIDISINGRYGTDFNKLDCIVNKHSIAATIGTIISVVTTIDWVISKIKVGKTDVKITQGLPESVNVQVSEAYKLFFVIEYKFDNSWGLDDEWIFFEYVVLFDGKTIANERRPKKTWIKDRDAYSKLKIELWQGAKEWDCGGNNDHTVKVIAMIWDDGHDLASRNPDKPTYPHHIHYNYDRYRLDPNCKVNPIYCVPLKHRWINLKDDDKDEMTVSIHNPFYITNQKKVTKRTHDGDKVSLSFDAIANYVRLPNVGITRPLKAEITIDPLNDKDNWDFKPEPTSQTWEPVAGKRKFKFEGVHTGTPHPGDTIPYDDEYSLKAHGSTTVKTVTGKMISFSWKTQFTKEYDTPNKCLPGKYHADCEDPGEPVPTPTPTEPVRLSYNEAWDVTPDWSPCGKLIAFVSNCDGNWEIYFMNVDGSGQTRLTSNSAFDALPKWSPDGMHIAFASDRDDNNEIYVMGSQTRLTHNTAWDSFPAWSPGGRRIAFVSNRDDNDEIYVMNADGSGQKRLTYNISQDYCPAWSPDDRLIAFQSKRDGNWEIYVMTADGSGQKRLTYNTATDYYPAWSPDGRLIAFMSRRDGNKEIYVMNADGSGQKRLTYNTASDSYPTWSPDGRRIAFQSDRDGNWEIYVMNADGSG